MSFNGSGVFNINSAGQPVVATTLITAAAFNAFTADVATGLSTCITKDGQTTVTANIPMAGFRFTGIGSGNASRTMSASTGDVQDNLANWCGTAGGTANALTLTPTPAITAYVAGQTFIFKSGASPNTGAATVNVSAAGAKAIQVDGAALDAGHISANLWYRLIYDGAAFQLEKLVAAIAPGVIQMYAGATAPSGYLMCDGTAVSRTTYAPLFTAIGTAFGAGDGSTTFNVPDLRGRSPLGAGTGSGLTARTLAATGGEEGHALTSGENGPHIHTATVTDPGHFHNTLCNDSDAAGGSAPKTSDGSSTSRNMATDTKATGITVANANSGSGTAHNTMHPFLVMNFIVKT